MHDVFRIGDSCSGHDLWPPRPAIEGSTCVFADGIGVVRENDAFDIHCTPPPRPACHSGNVEEGYSHVIVEGKPIACSGCKVSCGGVCGSGSDHVFVGSR